MNSKAIKRQLLAAIAMVLVAALALGSSTYAWFVASGSVTATGMQVNLVSEGGIVIRYGGEGDAWGLTATANMQKKDLLPTSTSDMTVWTYAKAQYATSHEMNEATYQNVTDIVVPASGFNENNPYVVMKEFHIRSSNETIAANGLSVKSVTVTKGDGNDATQDISNSLKVGLRWTYAPTSGQAQSGNLIMSPLSVGDGQGTSSYIFVAPGDPILDDEDNPTGYVELGANTTVNMKTAGSDATILENTVPIGSDAGHPVKIQVFIWYEGQDEHLYSDNVHAAEDLKVTIEFETAVAA